MSNYYVAHHTQSTNLNKKLDVKVVIKNETLAELGDLLGKPVSFSSFQKSAPKIERYFQLAFMRFSGHGFPSKTKLANTICIAISNRGESKTHVVTPDQKQGVFWIFLTPEQIARRQKQLKRIITMQLYHLVAAVCHELEQERRTLEKHERELEPDIEYHREDISASFKLLLGVAPNVESGLKDNELLDKQATILSDANTLLVRYMRENMILILAIQYEDYSLLKRLIELEKNNISRLKEDVSKIVTHVRELRAHVEKGKEEMDPREYYRQIDLCRNMPQPLLKVAGLDYLPIATLTLYCADETPQDRKWRKLNEVASQIIEGYKSVLKRFPEGEEIKMRGRDFYSWYLRTEHQFRARWNDRTKSISSASFREHLTQHIAALRFPMINFGKLSH